MRARRSSIIFLVAAALSGCPDAVLHPMHPALHLPEAVDVGTLWVGYPATRTLVIENVSAVDVKPFVSVDGGRVRGESHAVSIAAGAARSVDLVLEAMKPGPLEGDALVVTLEGVPTRLPLSGTALIPESCPQTDPCSQDSFDPATGSCASTPLPDGVPCEGTCVVGTCAGGVCRGQQRACPDDVGNACTVPACDALRGCTLVAATCRPSSRCMAATCDPQTGCEEAPVADGTSCGEGNCDQDYVCIEGRCEIRPPPEGVGVVRCLHATRLFVPWDEGVACSEELDGGSVCWGSVLSAFEGVEPYILDEQRSAPWFVRFEPSLRFVGAGNPFCGVTPSDALVCKVPGPDRLWATDEDRDGGFMVPVPQLAPANEVMRLDNRLCRLSLDGTVECMSAIEGGSQVESLLDPGVTAVQVHGNANGQWPCIVRTDGVLLCRGVEDAFRRPMCFEPTSTQRFEPLPGWPRLRQFSAAHTFACGVGLDGRVYCGGSNGFGELGRNPVGSGCLEVMEVPGLTDAVKVQVALSSACALLQDGRAYCWGRDHMADDFTGGPTLRLLDESEPIADIGMALASGGSSEAVLCLLTLSGRVKCAGGNHHGEAGVFTSADGGARPRVVTKFRAIEAPSLWMTVPAPTK